MADVVITIPVSSVSYTTWLRTSYIASALKTEDGTPLIISTELGPDQGDALTDFMEEATREVLKLFLSRQGDAAGVPFEYDGTDVTYRFNEETPLLPQASAIKDSLEEDVKNAIFTYVTTLWYKLKLNADQIVLLVNRYEKVAKNIDRHLYKLHD
jgi:hypothetical protein